MKNIYEIGYSCYEEAPYVLLTHEKKYTQREFDELILKCSLIEYKRHKKEYFEIFKDDDDNWYEYDCHFETIYPAIINRLIHEYKFKRIEASVKFNTFNDSLNNPRYTEEHNIKPIQKAVQNYEKNNLRLKKIEKFI